MSRFIAPRGAAVVAALAGSVYLGGCESETTDLEVRIYGESFIEDGITAADVDDGWAITWDRFLVAVGDVTVDARAVPGRFAYDLTAPSGGRGQRVADVVAASDADVGFRIAPMSDLRSGNSDDAARTLEQGGWSMFVQGVAIRGAETKRFAWGFATDTAYSPCPRKPGDVAQLTIHADHLLFDDLDDPEPNVVFDRIASADVDGDGEITRAELEAVDITTLERYQVGGREITDLWTYLGAQTRTVGHIDGEGHCERD